MALGQVSPGPDMLDIGSDYTRMDTIKYAVFFRKMTKIREHYLTSLILDSIHTVNRFVCYN